jgi:hypothetical protein
MSALETSSKRNRFMQNSGNPIPSASQNNAFCFLFWKRRKSLRNYMEIPHCHDMVNALN